MLRLREQYISGALFPEDGKTAIAALDCLSPGFFDEIKVNLYKASIIFRFSITQSQI